MSPLEHVIDDLRRSIDRSLENGSGVDLENMEGHLSSIDDELELHREMMTKEVVPALCRIADALERMARTADGNEA